MAIKKKEIIKLTMLIIWMVFIFYMSNQPAEISNEQSGAVLSLFNFLGINLNGTVGGFAMTIIRKLGHLTEYMILFILAFSLIKEKVNKNKAYIIGFIFVFVYACTDEFHQLFIPGRAGKFTDVIIDCCGASIAILIIKIINITNKKRQ